MTFQLQNFSRVSVSANEEISDVLSTDLINKTVTPHVPYSVSSQGCFRTYNYISKYYPEPTEGQEQAAATGDTQKTISSAGYFNQAAYMLQVGDVINAYSTADNTYVTYNVIQVPTKDNPTAGVRVGSALFNINLSRMVSPIFSPDDLLNINITPLLLIDGIPGAVIVVDTAILQSSAGNAYTGGSDNIYLGYFSAPNPSSYKTAASGDGFIKSQELFSGTSVIGILKGGTPYNSIWSHPSAANLIGMGVYLTSSSQITGGTQRLQVTVTYSVYPKSF